MRPKIRIGFPAIVVLVLAPSAVVPAQAPQPFESNLLQTGQVSIDGREVSYRIRNLPVSSFPDLPLPVAEALSARNCLIPQTYEAYHPENVIHGSFEGPGSSDWAVLCSARGTVSLLVFFGSAMFSEPQVLAAAPTINRLQPHNASGELGFDWGIDSARPQRVHDAQAGIEHRPPPPDHDCVADSIVDGKTVYHLYRNGAWEKVHVED